MSVPTISCEVIKHGYRQSRDGIVLSLIINPADMPDALAVAPLGQRYMIVLAAIGTDEQPLPVTQTTPAERSEEEQKPPSDRSVRGKERYAASTERQQARDRASMLPKDGKFQHWVWDRFGFPADEGGAVEYIRHRVGGSRRNIAGDDVAYTAYIALETDYRRDAGLMPEMR